MEVVLTLKTEIDTPTPFAAGSRSIFGDRSWILELQGSGVLGGIGTASATEARSISISSDLLKLD